MAKQVNLRWSLFSVKSQTVDSDMICSFPLSQRKTDLQQITSWHFSSSRGWFASVLHEIALSSAPKVYLDFSGFIWVSLSLSFWGEKEGGGGVLSLFVYLVLIAAQAVNIMMAPVGRVFDNLGKKFQIKSFRRFRVFVLSYKANLKRPK